MRAILAAAVVTCVAAGGCAIGEAPPVSEVVGTDPQLPQPRRTLLPTMKTAKAEGWPQGAAPTPAAGFEVGRFAEGLDHPRWAHVLPNGDVLVTLATTKTAPPKSIRDWIMNRMLRRVGAAGESPDQVVLLRDADGDGRAEMQAVLIEGLNQPFGMLYQDGHLYVANTDSVVRFAYQPGQTQVAGPGETVLTLPGGGGHWTRNIVASPDGGEIYVSVGSTSNIADEGLAAEEGRALILRAGPDGAGAGPFATGLRNPNGMDFEPETGALWTVVNERDLLGDNLAPDYLTSVAEGDFFGWPWSYWGDVVDERVEPANPQMVERAREPDYALGAHVAALGLTFYDGESFPPGWRDGAYIGLHGSWNRSEYSGYKVIFVPFQAGQPAGAPRDLLTGFLPDDDTAYGRPVGVEVAVDGALLVVDDVGGIVWRIAPNADSVSSGAALDVSGR